MIKFIAPTRHLKNAGNKYIQIDTYGRMKRETPEKSRQSLLFGKKSAKLLVDLLIGEFNLNLV